MLYVLLKRRSRCSIRNPLATRPWQHVLEPLSGYLALSQALFQKGAEYAGAWNFGPFAEDTRNCGGGCQFTN
jgi:CDP-glucose 4,6-dehydratase